MSWVGSSQYSKYTTRLGAHICTSRPISVPRIKCVWIFQTGHLNIPLFYGSKGRDELCQNLTRRINTRRESYLLNALEWTRVATLISMSHGRSTFGASWNLSPWQPTTHLETPVTRTMWLNKQACNHMSHSMRSHSALSRGSESVELFNKKWGGVSPL